MEESIARAISKCDEAKAFTRIVPLDRGLDGWARGALELWTARRRISEIARRRLVVVVGKVSAAVWTKISISISHVSGSRRNRFNHTLRCTRDRQRVPTTPLARLLGLNPNANREPEHRLSRLRIKRCLQPVNERRIHRGARTGPRIRLTAARDSPSTTRSRPSSEGRELGVQGRAPGSALRQQFCAACTHPAPVFGGGEDPHRPEWPARCGQHR